MDNRDMFYNSYGYSAGYPMWPNMMWPNQNNYNNSNIDSRINQIENMINKLNQRITKLENISSNSNIEPDNNLYML